MSTTTINPDLLRERKKCNFNTKELTYMLDGGEEETRARKQREKYFFSDPELIDKIPNEFLSHKEKYEESMRKAVILCRKLKQVEDESSAGVENYQEIIGGQIGSAILKDGNPLGLHYAMFIPTILGQGSVDQQFEWINKAWNCDIIGTYAQTELGHGTFIRGLETTATYDVNTKQFILNSPTLTSFKWWPGGLGHSVNHAIIVAQLYIKEKCYGIHTFIVQLRDLETHKPLPGIKIGEIGHKMGMNGTNNGFLGFENVKIPRENMLMKNSRVLEDGTYIKPKNNKLTYGTMMFVRVVLVKEASFILRKALTIAIRYSAVRRQSTPNEQMIELQILDYVAQQAKLFPLVAATFAIWYSATFIWSLYNEVAFQAPNRNQETEGFDYLPELHALACCLKAISTSDATAGIEIARLSCGGHGYMTASNLPTMYGLVSATCTYEGENTVLLLQCARFLMKTWKIKLDGQQLTPIMTYLNKDFSKRQNDLSQFLVDMMEKVAIAKINFAYDRLMARTSTGIDSEKAWNESAIDLVQAAEAHGRAFILSTYLSKTLEAKSQVSLALYKVLKELCDLYIISNNLKYAGDLLRFTEVSARDIVTWQDRFEQLLQLLRPNIVGIVDGFDIADEILSSALGAYDGNVYERLFIEAMKSPLNADLVNSSFEKYLKPLMKAHL